MDHREREEAENVARRERELMKDTFSMWLAESGMGRSLTDEERVGIYQIFVYAYMEGYGRGTDCLSRMLNEAMRELDEDGDEE